jgi:hypothetical protein
MFSAYLNFHSAELMFCAQLKDKILKTCKVILAYLDNNPKLKSKVWHLVKGIVEWVKVLSKA